MKLNIVVSSEKYDALKKALTAEKMMWPVIPVNKSAFSFINVNRCRLEPPLDLEIELEIQEVSTGNEGRPDLPNRDHIDKLWDILGIFPRTGKIPEKVDQYFRDLHNATSMIETIIANKVKDADLKKDIVGWTRAIVSAEEDLYAHLKKLL